MRSTGQFLDNVSKGISWRQAASLISRSGLSMIAEDEEEVMVAVADDLERKDLPVRGIRPDLARPRPAT